jgi:hypothetical protein
VEQLLSQYPHSSEPVIGSIFLNWLGEVHLTQSKVVSSGMNESLQIEQSMAGVHLIQLGLQALQTPASRRKPLEQISH